MKRFFITIFAFLYISTSTGAIIHLHYCMGELANWGLGYNQTEVCGKCGMNESDINDTGCCKDEHTFIKNDNDQKIIEGFYQFAFSSGIAYVSDEVALTLNDISSVTEENPSSNAPPRSNGVAVYIFNRTFLI
jgi:hypothetical protein